jgi:hypothetical protein
LSRRYYQFHELTMCIDTDAISMPWIFKRFHFNEVEAPAVGAPDLTIVLEPTVEMDSSDCLNFNHDYFARPGELYFGGRWKGHSWRTHWRGLAGGPIVARLALSGRGALSYPWLLHADWVVYWCVFKPLAELIWARRDVAAIHAASASRDGKAVMFTGYGSGLNASFAMSLVRRGWKFLGDDQVLLSADRIHALPYNIHTFDFRVHHLDTEHLTPLRLARLGWHLLRAPEPRIQVEASAELTAVNVCIRSNRQNARKVPVSADTAAAQTFSNCYNESIASVHGKSAPYTPLRAYSVMFPEADLQCCWPVLKKLLAAHFGRIPTQKIEMTARRQESFMDYAELGGLDIDGDYVPASADNHVAGT